MTLDPPELMSGSVRPFVGKTPMFTPIDTSACRPMHKPMPNAQ